jgi:hypothetical protein
MSKGIENKIDSMIYQRLNEVHMSEVERQRALNALKDADLFADAVIWIAKKIEQLGGRLFLKPALKN